MDSDFIERARRLVADHLGREIGQVTDEANFIDDLDADSLDVFELAMTVEEHFGVEMSDNDAEKVFAQGTFADLAAWLEKQRTVA